jgi:hypothetical protein
MQQGKFFADRKLQEPFKHDNTCVYFLQLLAWHMQSLSVQSCFDAPHPTDIMVLYNAAQCYMPLHDITGLWSILVILLYAVSQLCRGAYI